MAVDLHMEASGTSKNNDFVKDILKKSEFQMYVKMSSTHSNIIKILSFWQRFWVQFWVHVQPPISDFAEDIL